MKILSSEGKEITIGSVTGTEGTAVIGSQDSTGTVNLNTFEQNKLTISGGVVNADASVLNVSTGVDNNALLNLRGTSLRSSIRGEGSTYIQESMTSDKTIVQNTFGVSEDVVAAEHWIWMQTLLTAEQSVREQ